jgi:hypothetical protein
VRGSGRVVTELQPTDYQRRLQRSFRERIRRSTQTRALEQIVKAMQDPPASYLDHVTVGNILWYIPQLDSFGVYCICRGATVSQDQLVGSLSALQRFRLRKTLQEMINLRRRK